MLLASAKFGPSDSEVCVAGVQRSNAEALTKSLTMKYSFW